VFGIVTSLSVLSPLLRVDPPLRRFGWCVGKHLNEGLKHFNRQALGAQPELTHLAQQGLRIDRARPRD
jgi:hypothetical protein